MGALLARRQLSGDADGGQTQEDQASYVGELFLMAAGALFFALNVAPTEEMILIAYKAGPIHVLGLMAVSILLLHIIVFRAGFAGQEEADRPADAFFHFTLPGYAIEALREALPVFGRKIKGFDMHDAVLTGVETRTSSPLKIGRGENLQSLNTPGLYPAGEGASYAGGILSAGVDGIKVGEAVARSLLGAAT